MSNNIQAEIISLSKRIQTKDASENEVLEFLLNNRTHLMENSTKVYNSAPPEDLYRFCTTCSCGHETSNTSCKEDGEGNYSEFYINKIDGSVIRNIRSKVI